MGSLTSIIASLLFAQVALAQVGGTYSTSTLQSMATWTAKVYGLNQEHFLTVINCESGWDSTIQSTYPDPDGPGGHEDSWGLVQIHLPAHPDVTREQAQDAAYSIQWMAEQWRNDKAYMWSCWRDKYGKDGN